MCGVERCVCRLIVEKISDALGACRENHCDRPLVVSSQPQLDIAREIARENALDIARDIARDGQVILITSQKYHVNVFHIVN